MNKLVILLVLGAVACVAAFFIFLLKRSWGRWGLGTLVWLAAIGACLVAYDKTSGDARLYEKFASETAEVIAYHKDIQASLEQGKQPAGACKFRKKAPYRCYCVKPGEAEDSVSGPNRTPTASGDLCFDEKGIAAQLAHERYHLREDKRTASKHWTNAWLSLGALGVTVLIMIVAIVSAVRKRGKGATAAPAHAPHVPAMHPSPFAPQHAHAQAWQPHHPQHGHAYWHPPRH